MNVFDVLREKLGKCKDSHLRLADDTKEMTELQFAGCYTNAIEIVNQVERAYDNDFCEWEYDEFEDGWQTSCDTVFLLCDSDKEITNFCPHCGKKIAIRTGD